MFILENISIRVLEKNDRLLPITVIKEDIVLQRINKNTFKVLKDRTGGFLSGLLKGVKYE